MYETELDKLIARIERRNHMRMTTTATVAALGLVAFGVMLTPIYGRYVTLPTVHTQVAQAPAKPAPNAYANLDLIGKAAIVYDLSTGKVLYGKNAEAQLPLASLTKLLTTYASVTDLAPNASVVITHTALAQEGDSGLSEGEQFAMSDLARYALVASSNDAAEALSEQAQRAQATTGANLMASVVTAIGLTQTYALNGTGLDLSAHESGAYGSASDIAKLAGALLAKAPEIANATILPSVTIHSLTGKSHTLPNTNQEIDTVPNPLLSKTGYTDLAGGNLVVVYDAGINHPIAVVVLGSTHDGRFTDVSALVNRTLDHFAGIAPK